MEFLRKNLDYKIYGSNLLPEKFTMKELQNLYEYILGEPLRRNNFQRKNAQSGFSGTTGKRNSTDQQTKLRITTNSKK